MLPRQFGKYTLLRSLAKGGMAEVYLALQRAVAGFEKLVVIKRILPELSRDQAFVEMLLHEARIAATLSHPNIVQTFDVGEVEGTYYIAMEYINGEDIRAVVRAMKRVGLTDFPAEHALSIVLGVCAGLSYAHEKRDLEGRPINIVHRDVSPQNVLLTFDGDVKVVDFGIAKSAEAALGEKTGVGTLKGKVPYMSPEQASGQLVDHRSDIFSVGIVLFELSTGRRLFKAKTEFETLKLICERDYPRPSQVRPGYPPGLELIVMKSLERDVERRYQSARELQADLETFIRNERVAASTVNLGNWMKMLFEDKITQQKEALQDVKQLADVIATQYSEPGDMHSLTSTGSSLRTPGGSTVDGTDTEIGAYTTVRRSSAKRWLAVGGLVMAVGGAGAYLVYKGPLSKAPPAASGDGSTAGPAGPGDPPAAKKGALTVKTEPEGCDVWLNGELQKSVTPATLEGLPLDREMQLKVSMQGYESYVESFTLGDEEMEKTIEIKMVKGSVTVVIKVSPKPVVYIDDKKWGGEGDRIEELSAGEHKIVVVATGHIPQTFKFTAKKGETKTIEATLVKGQVKPGTTSEPVEPKDTKPKGSGKINVAAKGGYCNVSINGRSVGPTPVAGIVVPAGPVSVTCRTPDGKTLASGATVEPNKTARVFFRISK